MTRMTGLMKALIVMGAALSAAACASYPSEPQYSTRAAPASARPPVYEAPPPYEPPPPAAAPVERIDGGALPPPVSSGSYTPPPAREPAPPPAARPGPSASRPMAPGAAYVIQPGDTISGVGRRFQTPIQVLIDLNGLGPRAAITEGQSIILPDSAVDGGPDPYATGPSPRDVVVPNDGPPPPPPPPAARPAPPRPAPAPAPPVRGPAPPQASPAPQTSTSGVTLQWPVRGEIVRRFGPVGLGERNNGINIAAPAGEPVNAAAAGRVAYVGDDLVGQGLTVLIVHRDGWRTVYGHLGSATVDDGAEVRQGQQIGTVGLTAGDGRPSIHFETRRMQGDNPVAVDPLTVLPR